MAKLTLLPQPRQLEIKHGTYNITSGKTIALLGAPAQELLFTAERLQETLRRDARANLTLSATQDGETAIVLRVMPDANASPESYTLDITRAGIEIVAPSPRGLYYGVCTLLQIVQQCGNILPALHISDTPDFPHRGVMWDISRTRVLKLETLFELVDLLASWKINQLQLYTEHTFAYRNHRVVWEHASPLTAQDILELDAFCRARYIELVPNQNSFGHMHRWLRHKEYLHLAEFPEGYTDTKRYWWAPSAFGLNPTDPRTLEFLRGLYGELLPNFSSRYFNAGLDETIDLGKGKSAAAVEARGVGAVYLDFLKKIHALVSECGKTMMFWGDIIIHHPELIPQLPRDVIALEWGYEADHPFDEHGAQFAKAGIPFYVCPGTSSWISIIGRTDNAMENIRSATENGLKHGAVGVLNTDWGDWGHWQMLPISYLGLAYGAAMSWGVHTNREINLRRALDLFAFRDKAGVMGRAAYDLGNTYRALGVHYHNASGLARVMYKSLDDIRGIEGQTRAGFQRALRAMDKAAKPLARAHLARRDGTLIQREFAFSARLAKHGARRGILAFEKNPARAAEMKRALDQDLRALMKEYKRLWNVRNRPGGFEESVGWMERAREAYRK